MSKSDVVRERLARPRGAKARQNANTLDLIADLIGSVKGLPPDLGRRKKHYFRIYRRHSRQGIPCLMPRS